MPREGIRHCIIAGRTSFAEYAVGTLLEYTDVHLGRHNQSALASGCGDTGSRSPHAHNRCRHNYDSREVAFRWSYPIVDCARQTLVQAKRKVVNDEHVRVFKSM
jgi:hypothetical protein